MLLFPCHRAGTFIEVSATSFVPPCACAFPRFRAGTFIEVAQRAGAPALSADFPVFGRGLSLRHVSSGGCTGWFGRHFPAFGWGLSLRTHTFNKSGAYYEMFSPGGGAFIEAIKPLSRWAMFRHFSAFGRRLSLRPREHCARHGAGSRLLHLWVGTFIEAHTGAACG